MTTQTQRVHIGSFICTALTLIGVPFIGHAMTENTLASTSESVVASTTVVEAAPSWFRLEKLSGDNLAVGDFVVGPGRTEVEVKPGETVTVEISVANRISDDRTFELTVEDVAGSDDATQAIMLFGAAKGPYTVKDYISFPQNTFSLDLGERARIPVTITMPENAAPGGYYGSVLISTVRVPESEPEAVGGTRAPIVARVGTLFFITVPGAVERSGELQEITLKNDQWWYEKGPVTFNVLYENTGSVHLNPYGELQITNIFGEEVGFVELEPWFALPQSLRSREVTWDRELLLGRYKATVRINRGYDDIVDERSVAFWVMPWKVMGGIFLAVFLVFLGLRLFFRSFEFKRKT